MKKTEQPTSWLSPTCEARDKGNGHHGVFAREPIPNGDVIAVWGGDVFPRERFDALPDRLRRLSIQVEEDMFLVAMHEGPGDYVNHCCNPNAGLSGQIVLVAMRHIQPGEEICFDYAMSDGSNYDEFECHCGATVCRHTVRGTDWQNPTLWERYAGYFSPYLQRRIERIKKSDAYSDQPGN